MNVQIRNGFLHSTCQINVKTSVHVRRQTCLHAHFGRAHINCFVNAADNLIQRQEISLFAAIYAAERAKAAVLHTDIREVHISIDNVRDDLTHLPPAQLVGGQDCCVKLSAGCQTELKPIVAGNLFTVECPRKNLMYYRIEIVEQYHAAPYSYRFPLAAS